MFKSSFLRALAAEVKGVGVEEDLSIMGSSTRLKSPLIISSEWVHDT